MFVIRDDEGTEVWPMGDEDSHLRMSKFSCLPGLPRVSLVVISGNSDVIERWSESKALTADWSRSPREAVTDVTARLPKHLMVDTLERRHNTDQHDGCQIQTGPAVLLPALNSCMGRPVRAEEGCGHCLCVRCFCGSAHHCLSSQSSAVLRLSAKTPKI